MAPDDLNIALEKETIDSLLVKLKAKRKHDQEEFLERVKSGNADGLLKAMAGPSVGRIQKKDSIDPGRTVQKTESKSSYKGPVCGAKRLHADGVCQNPAGFATEHVGQGRCKFHGGCGGNLKHGRYSLINRASIREQLDKLKSVEEDVLDLTPEVELLRAVIIDYVNRYDTLTEALFAWHNSFLDPMMQKKERPKQVIDISDVSRMIGSVANVVSQIHKIRTSGAISLETLKRVLESMGIAVARHVKDDAALRAIEAEWRTIRLEPVPKFNSAEGGEGGGKRLKLLQRGAG
jgi:hypothetical protein